jgi:exonuclease VII large subunit
MELKNIKYLIVVISIIMFSNINAQKTYTPEEAKDHLDEVIIIKGEVTQVSTTRAGQVYFNMGGKYPQNKFSAVILKTNVSKFDNIKDYEGKIVEVTGKVKIYNSKPEIVLEKKEQIKIIPKEEAKENK